MAARRIFLAAVTLAGAMVSTARADLEVGTYAPDLDAAEWVNTDEPVSLAELRGMCVIVVFWVSWHKGAEFVMPLMSFINSRIGRGLGVYIVGVTDSERKKVDKFIKDEKVFFPVACGSKSMEEYKITSYPRAVVIDPEGKIAWSGWPGVQLSDNNPMIKAIEKVLEDTPPSRTHPEEAVLTERRLGLARQSLRDGSTREAYEAAKKAIEHTIVGDPLRSKCQDMLDLIESLGRDMLAQSQEAVDDKRFEDAVTLLRQVRRDFIGLEVARTARKRLDGLKKRYPEVAAIVEKNNDSAQAELQLAGALEDFRSRSFGDAFVALERIVSDYPESEAAEKARTVIARTEKVEGIMGYVHDHKASREANSLLAQGRAFEAGGRINRAKELYREVLEKFDDTIYADEAVRRLQRLP